MVVQNSSNIPSVTGTAVVGTGTAFSTLAYATTPTASTLSERDANSNLSSNNFIAGYATTATAAGTTTLTVASEEQQYFTGTTTQTVVLPVTSTLVLGQSFVIVNKSTGVVTVQSSGANTIQAMDPDSELVVTVVNTGVTTAAGWNAVYSTTGGAGSITLSGDSGSATGNALLLTALNGADNSGGTVKFTASGTTVVLNVSDASNNTFIGLDAGNTTYTGIDNTAIGRSALAGLTSGAENVAIGQQTLLVNTNGLRNVAIGGGTLNSSVTGDDNIAIGTGALTLSDGSSNNIAIGTSALSGAVATTQNIAIGNSTLGLLNGGSQNVAIGPQAGGQVSNGTYNLYIGWSAGFLNDAGENYNIYLNSPGVAGESNTLRLGAATGTSAQELNKAFIYGINGAGLTGTPALVVIDPATDQLGSSLTLATAPPASSTATSGFGSLAVGTALQNTLGYDILVNVSVVATVATGATIVLGVGPTNTPTTNAVTAAFSVGLTSSFCAVVPSGYYCLVNTTGTITVGSITTQVCPL